MPENIKTGTSRPSIVIRVTTVEFEEILLKVGVLFSFACISILIAFRWFI